MPVTDAITGSKNVADRANIDMFDVRYQLRLNEIFDLASTSVLYYNMIQRHLSLIEETLVSSL